MHMKNKDVLKKRALAIEHSCDFDMPHISFDCGYWIESEDFHIGDYHVTFKDGSKMTYPIIWGENIGPGFSCKGAESDDQNPAPISVMEAAGIALVHKNGEGRILYRILIPTEKAIESVSLSKTSLCKGEIEFSYEISEAE